MMTPDINEILARPENIGCSRYGANMGRINKTEGQPEKLYLQKVRFTDGDYDRGGAYWGGSHPLWCAFSPENTKNECPVRVFVRGANRTEAKRNVLKQLKGQGWSFFR